MECSLKVEDRVRHKTDPNHPEGKVTSVRRLAAALHAVTVKWDTGMTEHCLVSELEKIS